MGRLKRLILDLLFPCQCLGCNVLLFNNRESYVCSACLAEIKMKNDFACAFCNSQVVEGKTCPFCKPNYFLDRLFVTTSYENPLVEKIIKTMKYRFVKALADDMAELMAKYLKRRFSLGLDIDLDSFLVVPVPLHRRRLNWRGFNQAEIIGRQIGVHLGLNFQGEALKRNRHRTPQARISNRESRIANIKGVFECRKPQPVQNKIILLIDDVATTASTLNDCARALKGAGLPAGQAGAREVIGFVFTKGTPAWDKKLLQKS